MIRRVWLLALNDLRLTWRDPPAFLWMLAMPIAMMWLFGGFGDRGGAPARVSIHVVNHDQGWLSQSLIDELQSERLDLQQLDPQAPESSAIRTLTIPAGFSDAVLAGTPQQLQLELAEDANMQFSMAAQSHLVRGVVRSLGRLIEMDHAGEANAERFAELGRRPQLVGLQVSSAGAGKPVPSGLAQSVPGNLTFIVLMMTLIYGGVFLTLEKQSGMLRRQAVAPLGRKSVLAGKLLGRLLLAAMQIALLLLAGRFLFGLPLGSSPLGLLAVMISYAAAVGGMSMFLGAVLRTPSQASAVGWIAAMVLAALGGCWWPSEVMPEWMQRVGHLFPTTWAMDAFHAMISFGRGLEAVWLPCAVLWGFALAASWAGARLLRFQ